MPELFTANYVEVSNPPDTFRKKYPRDSEERLFKEDIELNNNPGTVSDYMNIPG